MALMWTYRAKLRRVIDGDSLEVEIDLGLHCFHVERIRLVDVNTPEIFTGTDEQKAAGQRAKMFVEEWCSRATVAYGEWALLLHTFKDRQTFGRYLASVQRRDTTEDLGRALVDAGHAVWSEG